MLDGSKLRIGSRLKGRHNRSEMEIVDIYKDKYTGDMCVTLIDCKTGRKFPYGYVALLHCDVEILN